MSDKTLLCCNTQIMDLCIFTFAVSWLLANNTGFSFDFYKRRHWFEVVSFMEIIKCATLVDEIFLGNILSRSIWLQCSDPRDRIFGLLGLLRLSTQKCSFPTILVPDYTKSLPDVYCDAARHCMNTCEESWLLDMYGYERSNDNSIKSLPTWVSSWYCGKDYTFTPNGEAQVIRHAKLWTRGPRATEALLTTGTGTGKVLSIRGVVLETISKHSDF